MRQSKRKALEAKGWKVGSANDFLGLTEEELALIELKMALGNAIKRQRQKKRLTKRPLPKRLLQANPALQKWRLEIQAYL